MKITAVRSFLFTQTALVVPTDPFNLKGKETMNSLRRQSLSQKVGAAVASEILESTATVHCGLIPGILDLHARHLQSIT